MAGFSQNPPTMRAEIFGGRPSQTLLAEFCDSSEGQDRKGVGRFPPPILHRNRTTGKEVMRVLQRKRFGNFQCCVLPTFSNRRKTNTRRKSRRNYNNPLVPKLSGEADA